RGGRGGSLVRARRQFNREIGQFFLGKQRQRIGKGQWIDCGGFEMRTSRLRVGVGVDAGEIGRRQDGRIGADRELLGKLGDRELFARRHLNGDVVERKVRERIVP